MKNVIDELNYCIAFTEAYRSHDNKTAREAACLRLQAPHVLVPIEDDDLIAGRMEHSYIGFSTQYGGIYGYFFHEEQLKSDLKQVINKLDEEKLAKVNDMISFWHDENTMERLSARFEQKYGYRHPEGYTEPGITNCSGRVAGTNVDLDKLIRLGIPGLREEISAHMGAENDAFYKGLLESLDIFCDVLKIYENQARELAKSAGPKRRTELLEIADTLAANARRKPESFREGLQLFWIYAVISDLMNYGRMDVYLGDLYAADIDSGKMTEQQGIDLLKSLYKHLGIINKVHDCRIIIGGRGRRNESNADRLAMVIMEVSAQVKGLVPQLTLRYYNGMNDELYEKALRVNALGTTFPIIYSDETNIPAVMKVYDVPETEAEQYLPFGCGEYVIEGLSTGTPNNGVNVLKALEMVLFNGYDYVHDTPVGQKTGDPAEISTFEELWRRYDKQLRGEVERIAWHKYQNYIVAGEQADFLYTSLLMHDCIERGKALLEGGVRYLNAASEVFGIISAADSFSAIKKCVFDEKRFTMSELVKMLAADFEGYEEERKILQAAPKYGNDDDFADEMALRVFNHIADMTKEAGENTGLNKYMIVSVNNSMSAEWGEYCMASADGRKKGSAMSNGNGASIGCDKNGLTALLNSMSKFDCTKHVGVINNIRFSKEMFTSSFEKIKMLLETFYNNNGVQTNIAVVGRDDLQNAMIYPEKYQNLIVRIGGFSARFVELNPVVQKEILERTTY